MQLSKVEVRETLDASLTENADGFHQLKQYILIKEIGKGAFGKVHLAQDENTNIRYVSFFFSSRFGAQERDTYTNRHVVFLLVAFCLTFFALCTFGVIQNNKRWKKIVTELKLN